MKVRVELNYDEVAALKSFNFIVTGKELELPAIKRKADKAGESVNIYDGKTLISESKINPMFIIDIFKIAGTTYQLVKPIAEKVVGLVKEFKNKWVETKTEREFEDLVKAGYHYIIEYRSGDIVKIHKGNNLYAYVEYENIPKMLRVKDIIADEDITQHTIQYLMIHQ